MFSLFKKVANIDKADQLLEAAIDEYERLNPNLFTESFRPKLTRYILQLKHIRSGMLIHREGTK